MFKKILCYIKSMLKSMWKSIYLFINTITYADFPVVQEDLETTIDKLYSEYPKSKKKGLFRQILRRWRNLFADHLNRKPTIEELFYYSKFLSGGIKSIRPARLVNPLYSETALKEAVVSYILKDYWYTRKFVSMFKIDRSTQYSLLLSSISVIRKELGLGEVQDFSEPESLTLTKVRDSRHSKVYSDEEKKLIIEKTFSFKLKFILILLGFTEFSLEEILFMNKRKGFSLFLNKKIYRDSLLYDKYSEEMRMYVRTSKSSAKYFFEGRSKTLPITFKELSTFLKRLCLKYKQELPKYDEEKFLNFKKSV